jgi:hypothetical protein
MEQIKRREQKEPIRQKRKSKAPTLATTNGARMGHPSGLKAYSIFGENEDVVFIGGYSHDEQAPMEKNHGHRSICKPTLAYTRPLEFVTNEPAIAKRA